MSEEAELGKPADKTLMLFGRDVSKIPCFRNSILYGIGGGIAFGLARFMFTSQTLRSTNFAVYSFSFITMAYWIQCRYTYSVNKFEMLRLQELMQRQVLAEGTAEEQLLQEKLGSKPVDA